MGKIALLAPVPLVHLQDGMIVSEKMGKVAFGSRAWEVFRELERQANGLSIDTLIYASMADEDGPPVVTWKGFYRGHVESVNGAHPEGMKYRPPSTFEHPSDNLGYWAVFWEVSDLHELPEDQRILIKCIRSQSGRAYKSTFVPEGPIIVRAP